MKLVWALLGYCAGAVALAGLAVFVLYDLRAPADASASAEAAAPRTATPQPAATAAADPASDPNRLPVWIAPPAKYPPATINTAPRARALARGGGSDDWRLRERSTDGVSSGEDGWSSYAPTGAPERGRSSDAPRYREPIQFREKTEPR